MNMRKEPKKATWVLVLGVVGIISVIMTIVSDFILIGRPNSAYDFLKLGTESMADLADWRITTGAFLGVFVLPLQIAGLITVYFGLKPAGKRITLAAVITLVHALIMGVAFHVSYAYIASGWKLNHALKNAVSTEMMDNFDFYWKILVGIMLTEILIFSILFTIMILKGKTLYPKWMSLLNPLCIFIFMTPLILLPAPIGGFIAPAYFNIATFIFMTLSTFTIYRRL